MVTLDVTDRTVGREMFIRVALLYGQISVAVEGDAGDPIYRIIKQKLVPALMEQGGLTDREATDLVNRGLSAREMAPIHLNRGRLVGGIY